MATCLGIYVDGHIIKYAKVSREKDQTKVETFGVKVYTNFKETINQIITDTYSFKIPISINMSEEMYNYIYMSSLLSPKDLDKAIKTEFESYCYDKSYNPNALETRYVLVTDASDKEKIKVIHVAIDKIKLNNIETNFEDTKLNTITPISLSIANIIPINEKENVMIVNIEDTTTVTTVVGKRVYNIDKVNFGARNILDTINVKENSYAKAYEICKNSTIYTMEGKDLADDQNEHLSDIVPTLYQVANAVNDLISKSLVKINKVYITGTASVINNIDLYFEEIIKDTKCEILKPFFVENSPKINIKDYIEVNSAIALALQGLDYGVKNINFMKESKSNFLTELLSKKAGSNESAGAFLKKLNSINISNSQLSKFIVPLFVIVLVILIAYITITQTINGQINKKLKETAQASQYTTSQISSIKGDTDKINSKASEYETLTKKLQDSTNQLTEKNSFKNTIPVLLSELTRIIPNDVQITSIENTSEKKVTINVQSRKYEELAYFKAKLKSEGILVPTSVVSTQAAKEGDLIKVGIEGELP